MPTPQPQSNTNPNPTPRSSSPRPPLRPDFRKPNQTSRSSQPKSPHQRPYFQKPRPVPAPSIKITIPSELIYYCKSCEQIIDLKPSTFKLTCPSNPAHKEIAYGTERSIKNFYKIKDNKFEAERLERERQALRADKL